MQIRKIKKNQKHKYGTQFETSSSIYLYILGIRYTEMRNAMSTYYLSLISRPVVRPGAPAEAEQSVSRAGTYQWVSLQTAGQRRGRQTSAESQPVLGRSHRSPHWEVQVPEHFRHHSATVAVRTEHSMTVIGAFEPLSADKYSNDYSILVHLVIGHH